MEEWIKKSDAIDVIKKHHYRLEGHGLTEELVLEQSVISALWSSTRSWMRKSIYHTQTEITD